MSACAGIRDDKENALKARINHYGGTIRKTEIEDRGYRHLTKVTVGHIPERHFVDAPIRDPQLKEEFEEAVAEILSGGRQRSYNTINGYRVSDTPATLTQFGGPVKTLEAIALEMASAQVSAIDNAHPENAPSTRKKKHGRNTPLRDTYEMRESIQYWVKK